MCLVLLTVFKLEVYLSGQAPPARTVCAPKLNNYNCQAKVRQTKAHQLAKLFFAITWVYKLREHGANTALMSSRRE